MPAKRTWLLVICAVTIGAMALLLIAALLARRWAPSRRDWSFAFPYDGRAVADMHFSPDGRSLAVVSADDHTYSKQATWIYEVPSGHLRHQIEGGAWQCAWNPDGTILAVADLQGLEFDLWDTQSWTRQRHLSIPLSAAEKEIVRHLEPVGLSFDSHGNVYTAMPYTGWDGYVPQLLRAKVWWGSNSAVENSKSIGGCDVSSVDLSVAPMAQEMRVAISNEDVKCTLEILRIQDPGGKRIVRREYALTAGEAHGLHLARVRLTNDGKYLVAHDGTQLCVFELSNTQAKLVCSLADKIATSIAGVVLHLFDVSLNGHVAAYGAEHRIRVIRIPDGQIALEIEQEPDSLALSPDGRLLALVSRKRKSILLYHVPQAQK